MPTRLITLVAQLNAKRASFESIRHSPGFGIAPQVMRGKPLYFGCLRRLPDHLPEHLRCHAISPDATGLVDRPKNAAFGDATCCGPVIQGTFSPPGNWDCTNMASLANQISNHPMFLTQLD